MKRLLILFLAVLQITTAQTVDQKMKSSEILELTLDAAIDKALKNNWDIKYSEKEMQKAEEQINEAYASAFPRIDFAGRYTRNIKLPVLFIGPNTAFNNTDQTQTFEIGAKNNFDASVSISQVIYSQKVNTAIQIADEYAEMSKEGNAYAKQDIILAVKKAFYTVLLMEQLVEVTGKNYEVAKANYENVSAMFKQGVASEYDNLRAEVQLANTTPALTQTKNNLAMAKNLIKNITAIDVNQEISLKGKFSYEELPQSTIDEMSITAVYNHPAVKQLAIQASLLDKNVTIEKSEYYPVLSAFGQYAFQSQDNTFQFKNYNWAKTFMVGVNLQYTLFDGFRRGARIEQAIIDKEKVEITKNKLIDGLKIQVLQAKLNMEEAKKRIKAQEKNLEQAEKTLKIAQSRFKNGVGTQLELIDSQAALAFANTNYAQAVYDYLIAKAEWENVVSLNIVNESKQN
ncbi:MAG: TolC family protein [Ignavibacteriaceae bacterium]|nr:TolC family protein [Ignavibacteriaceae bacterium]